MVQTNNLICFGKAFGIQLTYWKNSHEKNLHHFFNAFFLFENFCLKKKLRQRINVQIGGFFVCWVLWNRKKRQSRHLAVMSTRNLRFRHVAIWRDPFLGGWPWDLRPVTVFFGGVGF